MTTTLISSAEDSPASSATIIATSTTAGRLLERWRGLPDLPARTALRVTNLSWLRHLLGKRYAKALALHAPRLPKLAAEDQCIVEALSQTGVYITSLDRLAVPGFPTLVADANGLAEGFAAEAHRLVENGETFVIVPPEQIVGQRSIYDWGLNDRLLAIAEAYIGLPVAYDGVAINYTVADGREVSTRKWHRDWEDRRMVKVAVYLHEVDTAGGPFEIIRRAVTQQDDIQGYRYDLLSDADLGTQLGVDFQSAIVSCVGPSGTVIFTDTARFFHRGKPAILRDRAALFYSYFSQRPRHPFFCERTGLKRSHIRKLAAPLPPRQRRVVLWRRQLPFWLRFIPPAQL